MTIEKILDSLKKILIKGFWGSFTVCIEDGKIVRIEKKESIKE